MAFRRQVQGDELKSLPFHGNQRYTYDSVDTADSRDRYATLSAFAFTEGGNSRISTVVYHEDWKWQAFTDEEFVMEARRILLEIVNILVLPIK